MKKPTKTPEVTDPRDNMQTDPRDNMHGFSVRDTMREIESAVTDAGDFYARTERNERIRQCVWDGKHPSGRKVDRPNKKAKPWNNAADYEVHLAQEVLLQLTAQRTAAMLRGSLSVTPMEGTDARAAAQMKLVMRYFLTTAMRSELLVQGTRWASWSLRYGHAILYVGWKTVKAMEKREVRLSEVVEFVLSQTLAQMAAEGLMPGPTPDGQTGPTPDGQLPDEQMMIMGEEVRAMAEQRVAAATDNELAAWLLQMFPELRERGKEADAEALRAAKSLRADSASGDPTGFFYAAFVKEDRPVVEALRQGIDFFCPAECQHEDSFDDARWLARVRWLSAQQIREQAAIRNWKPEWVLKVLMDCKGKSRAFASRTSKTPWALSGLGVGWSMSQRQTMDAETHLCQIVEFYDRRVTADGVQCLYKTVLHPDVDNMVAERELLADWHGHYPFVPATNEQDEPLLLANRGVPELVKSPQNGIKTQWDSRDDAASLTTLPPWTGPETLQGIEVYPGAFIPEWRTGTVSPWKLPPPDGRSVEIENTLRKSVDRYFGLMSKDVPEALTMLLGQVGVDWFLAAYSRAIALIAQLVQQRMSPLLGQRITGTQIVFSATREDVRGAFDFGVKFDVRALDIEWTKNILGFVTDVLLPLDNRAQINRGVLLQMGMDMIDPSLTDRALRSEEDAEKSEIAEMRNVLNTIFSGGVPEFVMGVDYATRAQVMQQDLGQSPVRQRILSEQEEIRLVWEDYLQRLLFQGEQEGANKQAGIEGGSDPLRQSPLARLKAGGWQAMMQAA